MIVPQRGVCKRADTPAPSRRPSRSSARNVMPRSPTKPDTSEYQNNGRLERHLVPSTDRCRAPINDLYIRRPLNHNKLPSESLCYRVVTGAVSITRLSSLDLESTVCLTSVDSWRNNVSYILSSASTPSFSLSSRSLSPIKISNANHTNNSEIAEN